ncbi:MAG: hypothetical protein QM564_01780 [Bergeyella sp.]
MYVFNAYDLGFIEDAQKYVNKIYDFVEQKITIYPAKDTPEELAHYGEKYLIYFANNHTSWYIFFSQIQNVYFVKFITNNHTEIIKNFNL